MLRSQTQNFVIDVDVLLVAAAVVVVIWSHLTHPVAASLALPETYFDVLKGEYVSRSESDRLFWSYDNSVDVLLYLELRQLHDKNTAVLVTAGSEGWIRAWSLHKLVTAPTIRSFILHFH